MRTRLIGGMPLYNAPHVLMFGVTDCGAHNPRIKEPPTTPYVVVETPDEKILGIMQIDLSDVPTGKDICIFVAQRQGIFCNAGTTMAIINQQDGYDIRACWRDDTRSATLSAIWIVDGGRIKNEIHLNFPSPGEEPRCFTEVAVSNISQLGFGLPRGNP